MKILCIAYRDWALEIYTVLDKSFQDHEFIIINSKKSYGGTSFENVKKMIKKAKNE